MVIGKNYQDKQTDEKDKQQEIGSITEQIFLEFLIKKCKLFSEIMPHELQYNSSTYFTQFLLDLAALSPALAAMDSEESTLPRFADGQK